MFVFSVCFDDGSRIKEKDVNIHRANKNENKKSKNKSKNKKRKNKNKSNNRESRGGCSFWRRSPCPHPPSSFRLSK